MTFSYCCGFHCPDYNGKPKICIVLARKRPGCTMNLNKIDPAIRQPTNFTPLTKTIWVKYCAFIITLAFQCEGKPPPGTTFSQKKLAWPSRGTDVARQAESCKTQRSWSPKHVFRIAHQPKNIKKSCLRAPKRNGTFTNRLAS